jgi:hypothetical protein
MATTIHAGDHTTDCGTCEQNERIKQNMEDSLDDVLESGDSQAFQDIFEDRDPFEFI